MRCAMILLALAAMISSATVASADTGPAAGTAPRVSAPAAARTYSYQRGRRRRGWFSGSSQNWYRSRGTPDDNSTIPTPINRHPKGHDPVLFPKNM